MKTDINITQSGKYSFLYIETNNLYTIHEALNVIKNDYKEKTGKDVVRYSVFEYFKMQKNSNMYIIKMIVNED